MRPVAVPRPQAQAGLSGAARTSLGHQPGRGLPQQGGERGELLLPPDEGREWYRKLGPSSRLVSPRCGWWRTPCRSNQCCPVGRGEVEGVEQEFERVLARQAPRPA